MHGRPHTQAIAARLSGQMEREVGEEHGKRSRHAVPRQVLTHAVLRAQAVWNVALDWPRVAGWRPICVTGRSARGLTS